MERTDREWAALVLAKFRAVAPQLGTREHAHHVIQMTVGPCESFVYRLPPRGRLALGAIVPRDADALDLRFALEDAAHHELPLGVRYDVRVDAVGR